MKATKASNVSVILKSFVLSIGLIPFIIFESVDTHVNNSKKLRLTAGNTKKEQMHQSKGTRQQTKHTSFHEANGESNFRIDRTLQSSHFSWDSTKTCQIWSKQANPQPRGIVATLVLCPDDAKYMRVLKSMICQSILSQLIHLIGPQNWDLLLVVAGDGFETSLNNQFIERCLNLTKVKEDPKLWINQDQSNITTARYLWQNSTNIYLSQTTLAFPEYVKKDPSILQRKIQPQSCDAPHSYILGTKWYADQMLHLAILKEYDWFIKLDIDIFFDRTVEWDLLHDLKERHSLFAHTAEIPSWSGQICANGIVEAVRSFRDINSLQCCGSDNSLLKIDRDFYYSNFILGRVDFWTQPLMLKFSRFLAEYQPGYFHIRWTDQIFWAQALGLFVGLDNVTNYSELRCSVEKNCWNAVFYIKLYGEDPFSRCDNNAYFRHNKDPNLHWNSHPTFTGNLWRSNSSLHVLNYKDECKERLRRKRNSKNELLQNVTRTFYPKG